MAETRWLSRWAAVEKVLEQYEESNRAGEMTSEVGGPGVREPKMTSSKSGKVIGFDQLLFGKVPI